MGNAPATRLPGSGGTCACPVEELGVICQICPRNDTKAQEPFPLGGDRVEQGYRRVQNQFQCQNHMRHCRGRTYLSRDNKAIRSTSLSSPPPSVSFLLLPPTLYPMAQVIVVGGGLAGLSAAHTILERGGNVLVLDKQPYGTFTPLLVFQLLPFPLASWVEILQRPPLVSTGLAPNPSKMLA